MSSRMVSIVLAFLLILSACSSETIQNDLDQALFSDSELECEFYAECGFSYHPSELRIDYGNLSSSSVKPTTDKSGLVYQWEQTSGLSSTNIKFDSQTGVISWHSNTDPGEYGFKVSAYDIVSGRVKSYNHQANFTLIISVKPISKFSYPQTNRVLFYKNSGRSQKPSFNPGVGPLVYRLTAKDGGNPPGGVRVLDNGQIEWKDYIQVGTNDLVVIASNFGGSKTARYRLVVSNQLDAGGLGVFLNTEEVIATYGTSLSTNLLRIEGLADGVGIADAFSLELTDKNGGAIPSEINLSPEGRLEIGHDSRSYLQVGSESNYFLKLGGKAYDYAEEEKEFSIKMLPKPVTNLGGEVARGEITYRGPIETTENVARVKDLILPNHFLVGSDTWPKAVDFFILRENKMFAPESIEIDAWGKISLSTEVAFDDSGNYLVRVEGKENYGGSVDIPVGVVVHKIKKNAPLNPLVKVDFYGKKISGISMSDQQMGLGDLLWKENWITIKPSGLDLSKSYQVVLRDDRGGEVMSSDLGNSGKEIRIGATNFNLEAKKKLVLLNEGKITVDLLSEGVRVVLSGEKILFTKAFKKIRNWRDLQAIDFAPALTNDYTLINSITLPASGSDGGLAGIDHAGNPHTMTDKGFEPIGDPASPFTGSFDGNGYQISGLWIKRNQENNVGLFGEIEGSGKETHLGVRDLTLELSPYNNNNIAIVGNDYTGALAGSIVKTKVSGVRVLGAGQVKGNDHVGGLIGQANNSIVENSDTEVSVEGSGNNVGGLVGKNTGSSEIKNSYATGKVSGDKQVGGLVGKNDQSTNENTYATGDVEGNKQVGGLVGFNSGSSDIKDSSATGTVSGNNQVGGLVGKNDQSTIENAYATGKVSEKNQAGGQVGGLVGFNSGRSDIKDSSATGTVSGNEKVGGLVGLNDDSSKISNSYAIGDVTGSGDFVGGLVGKSDVQSTIKNAYAIGNVTGSGDNVGGLVGKNTGSSEISYSYATGDVTGSGDYVGGLVGDNNNQAKVLMSYATGNVIAVGKSYIGGLVGRMEGEIIKNSYATGNVSGDSYVGGLVGRSSGGLIRYTYSIGKVSGNTHVGGLVGRSANIDQVKNSYWDHWTSGQDYSAGGDKRRTADMKDQNTFDSWGFVGGIWSRSLWTLIPVWAIDPRIDSSKATNLGYPYLKDLAPANAALSVGGTSGGNHGREISSLGFKYQLVAGIAGVGEEGTAPKVEGLVGNRLSEIASFRILTNGVEPSHLRMNHRGGVELKKGITLGDSGIYQVEITGKGTYQGVASVDVKVEIEPPPRLSDRARVSYQIVRTNGEATKGYLVSGSVNVPEGDRTYYKKSDEDWWGIDSDNGRIEIKDTFSSPSGDHKIKVGLAVAGYTGKVTNQVTVGVAEISFYGKDGGSTPDRQMGLGDPLWKEKWVTINVPTDGNYQLTLIDSDRVEVTSVRTGDKQAGKEVSFGVAEFNYGARGMWGLLDLKEGPMTARLEKVVGGSAYGVIDLPFTKAFKEVRNWRDLQAIGFAPALTNDYTLMNDITLPEPDRDGGLAGINHAGNSHKMDADGFNPIGDKDNPFTGTFYGNGHQISGLSINRDWNYVGLFGRIEGSGNSHLGVGDLTLKLSPYNNNNIAIAGLDNTGALAGYIKQTKVSGVSVLGAGQVKGNNYVGGLIGQATNSIVENSDTKVSVEGSGNNVGGLVGKNIGNTGNTVSSKISNSHATGKVSGNKYVGGLVGYNTVSSDIKDSSATGAVTGSGFYVGGLVGVNYLGSSVIRSYATGAVTGSGDYVGGLVGLNNQGGSVTRSYAVGKVMGDHYVGGLVGYNFQSEISRSYATGDVTGIVNRIVNYVGGLVGENTGKSEISRSYATGNVSGNNQVGGLVGRNIGSSKIGNSYAVGDVTGSGNWVGGLVGRNKDSSEISRSYATGDVTGSGNWVGGLVGEAFNNPTVISSYWDKQTSGWANSPGGGTGKSTSEMKQQNTFDSDPGRWDFVNTWAIDLTGAINHGYPYLIK